MPIRKQPFGYEMRQGEIVIQADEASLIQQIFAWYLNGESYNQLTHHLNAQPIPYRQSEPSWNKNMVARILRNEKYIGTSIYPQIVDQEIFHKVQKRAPEKSILDEKAKQIRFLQKKVVCAACGNVMSKNRRDNWSCPKCGISSVKMSDTTFLEAIRVLLYELVEAPESIELPTYIPYPHPDMEMKLEEAMLQINDDESIAIEAALSLANIQLSDIGSERYHGLYIKHLLENQDVNCIPITQILQITKEVLLYQDGTVTLKLKNDQIVERRNCCESNIS